MKIKVNKMKQNIKNKYKIKRMWKNKEESLHVLKYRKKIKKKSKKTTKKKRKMKISTFPVN